ncbi:MotA/TolQ/ExbB proton channel family protein [Rhodobacteraceae bacterium B1Z28]|uniref:MotA/TolQ/ExbB proton channel family protein n=1 Tax=Ruegeria haliotis TaxID=2747601 RepID=A0ABX2PVV0_9RHOB|nr:MotA/TolQ/ExbB proton channel family protein [Ruegeria haliotis]NVO58317.1 MotA/TolQ/ExbB proton channel family protein [Ruegeria haliotis]
MIKRLTLLAALVVAPACLVAQETPSQPAPELPANSPAFADPLPSIEEPEGTTSPLTPEPEVPTAETPADPITSTDLATPETPEALPPSEPLSQQEELMLAAQDASIKATEFLKNGGPSIWAIAALSVITVALILWKIWRLALIGAWSRGKAGKALDLFENGHTDAALATVMDRRGIRSKVVAHAITAIRQLPEEHAREETARVAKREIAQAGTGLRALELIATIAPLLGLLGTVLGMIAAFQALQQAGNRADPALLAGGIWEALLTTAAGMAVAIPASAALTWFEAVIDRIRRDVEDGATRLFVAQKPDDLRLVAE